ncbi:MAG TPA: aminopeptidase, partial [Candidatus Cloacimonas sp.]|nr:aminopeptidase [Candidatus Cloacimonas sp.]
EHFPEIFADTLKLNLLDSMHYAKIQQNIIDVLDKADYVNVKGKPGNDTDINVKLHPLQNPDKETNFENCVADVNIPVGEVFTSPLLTGTNGTLHIDDIYLGSLRFYNLKIQFEDGWIKGYSCTNFDDPEEGKKYIYENLLLPHKTLPIGEFAIGTNTLAYQMAKKYDILPLLPILIIEKMGPHFAIGDTCFSYEEDSPHPSFVNSKEMIAVDNEKSITRKEDPLNAYTHKHIDITLPYEMLESITAVTKDGERYDIIRNGRFVVPGTEELNIPLEEGV